MVTIESAKQTPLPERGGSYDYEFKGTSSDTKPTENVAENSLFYELDTGKFYYFTGSAWEEIPGAGGGGGGSSEWETLYESGAKHVKFKKSGAIGILEVVGPLDYDDVNFAEKHWPAGVEANFSFDLPAVFSPTGAINVTLTVNYYDETKSVISTSWTTGSTVYYFMYPLKG